MSRSLKRHLKKNAPPPEDEHLSDGEFDVPYSRAERCFAGLEISSQSESEHEVPLDEPEGEEMKPKEKQKKKKGEGSKKSHLNEVDECVKEVNKLLGEPENKEVLQVELSPQDKLLSIDPVHLNVNNEIMRLFGPLETDPKYKKAPRGHRLLKLPMIVPDGEYNYRFSRDGMSMSIDRTEDGIKYFRFEHDSRYQKKVRDFFNNFPNFETVVDVDFPTITQLQNDMQVEIVLEYSSKYFKWRRYKFAKVYLEMVVSYMQTMAHHTFKLNDRNVRLEYKYAENRPFHVALLKLSFLHSNGACHRSALEICKVLLNLDPSDPMAVVFIIDTFALRAREYQWLVDFVQSDNKDIYKLHNIRYSTALAHFHLAMQKKESTDHADELLKEAIWRFPLVITYLYESLELPLIDWRLFKLYGIATTSNYMKDLNLLYVTFNSNLWRQKEVLAWLKRNINEMYETHSPNLHGFYAVANPKAQERVKLFIGLPLEVIRHLSIIRDMSSLISNGVELPVYVKIAANPAPPSDGIDRYNYYQNYVPRIDPPRYYWLRPLLN